MPDYSDGAYMPAIADISKFDEVVKQTRGIFIKDVPATTILEVRTLNSTYTMVVVDSFEKKVKVRGGQFIPELTDAILSGSTFGGCMLKEGWIGIGMSLEIFIPGRELPWLTTSAVQTISVVASGSSSIH